ncbi:MAG: helix-turn-helix domain-containing protein, partial [Steroidobacteraceae bacterium]
QEPYPAIILDRHWNLLMANRGAVRLLRFLLGATTAESNILRLVFHPDGLRPWVKNWEELAEDLVRRVRQEAALSPLDETASALLAEVLSYPGVPPHWHTRNLDAPTSPLLTVVFRKDDLELRFFSTFTAFGTPRNITLDELRIESSFPADEATAKFCRNLTAAAVQPTSAAVA